MYFMREKRRSFSGDPLTIKDQGGNEMFTVDAIKLSIKEKKTLGDADGNDLCEILVMERETVD